MKSKQTPLYGHLPARNCTNTHLMTLVSLLCLLYRITAEVTLWVNTDYLVLATQWGLYHKNSPNQPRKPQYSNFEKIFFTISPLAKQDRIDLKILNRLICISHFSDFCNPSYAHFPKVSKWLSGLGRRPTGSDPP